MLTPGFIKQNKDYVKICLNKRGYDTTIIDSILEIYDKINNLKKDLEFNLNRSNIINKKISDYYNNTNKFVDQITDIKNLKDDNKKIKLYCKDKQLQLNELKSVLYNNLYKIPNIISDKVAVGTDSSSNEKIYENKIKLIYNFNLLDHIALCKINNIIDFGLGVKVSQSGFPVYKGKGAILQRALINYFIDYNISKGYTEFSTPYLVNKESVFCTGQYPDKDDQMYHIEKDKLFLIPTSEVPLTNIFRDSILNDNDLPVKLTGYSPCFRRESGSYGKIVKGLNRLHQFDKVEIVRIEKPHDSDTALKDMLEHVKCILEDFKLPYRILRLCSGDTGFCSYITYDFEVYSYAQDIWLEVSSVSNFNTFQSNRLKLRYKDKYGNIKIPHTLNGSSLAIPRILACIIENNQDKHNNIRIPKVLIPYTKFEYI